MPKDKEILKNTPIMMDSVHRCFLDKSIDATKPDRRSRGAIVRNLIRKAMKDKKLLD